jgi:glycosyltransferase involved in cell wall biosynthesis
MNNIRFKILFFASWYPNKLNPILGMFVKNKASTVSSLCDVAVIYVTKDANANKTFDIESTDEQNVFTVRVYFRTSTNPIANILLYNIRYLHAYYLAWKVVKRKWGIPDLIHVNVVDRAGIPALFFKWFRRIPFVITEHSTPDVSYTKGERHRLEYTHRLLKTVVWGQCAIGSVDSAISKRFLEKIGIKSIIRIIPNVVSTDKKILERTLHPQARAKKVGVHISILIERKNVSGILQAVAKLSAQRDDFEIHIIGTGEQELQLKEMARKLGILDRLVFFHGYVSEEQKVEFIASSDFHILNSDEEGFSVVTAESLSYGIPVIVTDCGGPEDFVSSSNGIMVKRRDIDDLTAALGRMLDTAHEFDRLQIRNEANARFSPEIVAQQTQEMYQSAKTMWPSGNTGRIISIPPSAYVLDVGSGHQPHRRANVLLDKYPEETIHRTTQEIVTPSDKTFVIGDALAMPFGDKSFDFVVASHIAEHVDDPVQFCREMSRVGKKGYIETPGPLTEILMPTKSHKWIVTKKGSTVFFRENRTARSRFPLFFRFFYLNREGYVDNTWSTSNPILKFLNFILLKLWIHIPYAYTCVEWDDSVVGVMKS